MVTKGRFLVVVSVLEGRKFPKRAKHELIVEARFDGELLTTDPVEHVESPDFTQELAWELDKKGLHQHKMQRTSIKVQVYAQDTSSTMKEPVGYVVLDLRSAQNKQQVKWCPLLHTKYNKSKPEVKLAIYIDDDKGQADGSFRAKEAPPREVDVGPGIDPKFLKPVLNDVEGYYQIGPGESCNEFFVLSVTVSFAENLPQLIPTSIALPSSGYFFYYSVLGNDVTNDVFHDIIHPNFPPERASVRIRSSVEALRAFLMSQPGIEVHLCCGDQSLGSAEVSLKTLLKKGSSEIYMRPVKAEGAFQLIPPKRAQEQLPSVADSLNPSVGVSVLLRKEDTAQSSQPAPGEAQKQTQGQSGQQRSRSPSPKQTSPKHGSPKGQKSKKFSTPPERGAKKREASPPPRLPSPPPPHDGSYTETFDSASRTDNQAHSLKEEEQRKATQPGGAGVEDAASSSATHHQVAVPTEAHHYSVSVDLHSVKEFNVEHSAVFLRYTYPFFGSSAPIITQPPVEVRRGMEVVVPQSFCTFDFATTIPQMQETFRRIPLVVEVWDKDKNRSQNQLLGVAQVHLSALLEAEKTRAMNPSGIPGTRQVWNGHVIVYTAEGQTQRLGEMNVILSVEDWGPINMQRVVVGGDSTSQALSGSESSQPLGMKQHHHVAQQQKPARAPEPTQEPRETAEYQAALELELWKEQQEVMFHAKLKQKEIQHMKALAEEWKKRDTEREVLAKRKEVEYQQLANKLQKRIGELEKREKQLSANEQEVLRLKKDLEREHERKMTEMREASRRMKEDFEHQVQLERAKIREFEEYTLRLKTQISEEEVKRKETELGFAKYKEQQNTKPEVRLQSEINLLTLEKVELERKLDSVTKSKIHYKQQWGRALKELAKLKQKEQTLAKTQLKKQQQELEHMRLRYLAAEEKEVVKSERQELEAIKNELNHLREQHTQQESDKSFQPMYPDTENLEAGEDDHITRLIEERDSLLRTGVYTTEDRIIAELDRQIRECIARKGR